MQIFNCSRVVFLLFGVFFAALSCTSSGKKNTRGVFLGGQINNAFSKNVLLYRDNTVIDSIFLNEKSRFERKYDSLVPGIYKLEHFPEYQTVFLERGDSLWVHINATSFDASIVFSGKGASKNNFLSEMEFRMEKEANFLSSKYADESVVFNTVIDSLLSEKKDFWIRLDSLNEMSPIAQKITQAQYIYGYATKRERYALLRGSYWSASADSAFFAYRKHLSYGDRDLAFFKPYVDYLLNFINEKSLDSGQYYFRFKDATDFNIRRLNVLDEEIEGRLLKNNLARAIAYEEILNFENHKKHEQFLQYYATVNTSDKYLSEILGLHNNIEKMQPQAPLPAIKLQEADGTTIVSNASIKGRPTVIYFWSQTKMNHYSRTLRRLKTLQAKFPKYRFVGICMQPFNKMVPEVQQRFGVVPEDQYAILDHGVASNAWMITLLNKGIVVDANGIILEGFGNFLSDDFEAFLSAH